MFLIKLIPNASLLKGRYNIEYVGKLFIMVTLFESGYRPTLHNQHVNVYMCCSQTNITNVLRMYSF